VGRKIILDVPKEFEEGLKKRDLFLAGGEIRDKSGAIVKILRGGREIPNISTGKITKILILVSVVLGSVYYLYKRFSEKERIVSRVESLELTAKEYVENGRVGIITPEFTRGFKDEVEIFLDELNNPKYEETVLILDESDFEMLHEFVKMIRNFNEKLSQNKKIETEIPGLKKDKTLKNSISDLNQQLKIQLELLKN
jgi:hypothetical protein